MDSAIVPAIERTDRCQQLSDLANAAISRSGKQLRNVLVARELVGDRVLPSSGTDDQDLHPTWIWVKTSLRAPDR